MAKQRRNHGQRIGKGIIQQAIKAAEHSEAVIKFTHSTSSGVRGSKVNTWNVFTEVKDQYQRKTYDLNFRWSLLTGVLAQLNLLVTDKRRTTFKIQLGGSHQYPVFNLLCTHTTKPKDESRADRLDDALALVDDGISAIKELQEEMEQWKTGMEDSEGLSQTAKFQEVEECHDALETAVDDLTSAKDEAANICFPGMF